MVVKVLWPDTSIDQLHEIFEYYCYKASISVASKIIKKIIEKTILLATTKKHIEKLSKKIRYL